MRPKICRALSGKISVGPISQFGATKDFPKGSINMTLIMSGLLAVTVLTHRAVCVLRRLLQAHFQKVVCDVEIWRADAHQLESLFMISG